MSTPPTRAQIQTQWANAIDILDQIEKFGRSNSKNLVSMLDTLEQSLQMEFIDEVEAGVQASRSNLSATVSPAFARAIQRPFLKQYCRTVIGKGNLNNDQSMLTELYKYFIDNSLKVQSRVITYGSPSMAGANVGNGQIVRLTVDDRNQNMEAVYIDSKRALCIADYQTGTTLGGESWQFDGTTKSKDELQRSGSGAQAIISGLTADSSILSNASFSSFGGTAASPTSVTNWTSSGGDSSTYYTFDSTNYFRAAPSDGTTSYAIKLQASTILTQKLSLTGRKLRTDRPYMLAVVWNTAVGTGVGTLNLRMGVTTTTITVNGQSGWVVTLVPVAAGQSAWYRLFAQNDMQVALDWARTSGTLLIDDVILAEGTPLDGSYYWVLPASAASFIAHRRQDQATWSDTSADTAKIQKWLWRAWGVYLPSSNTSSVTFTDP